MAIEPTTALYIASGVLGFSRYSAAAKAAQREAGLTARRLKTQAEQRQLQQLQEHNEVMENLQSMQSTNFALAGISGRDTGSDRSFKRILEKAKEDAYKTASRVNLQNLMDQSKIAQQTQMALLQGQNKSKAYRMMGFQSILNTAYGTSKVT
jgi:hypothetical protein